MLACPHCQSTVDNEALTLCPYCYKSIKDEIANSNCSFENYKNYVNYGFPSESEASQVGNAIGSVFGMGAAIIGCCLAGLFIGAMALESSGATIFIAIGLFVIILFSLEKDRDNKTTSISNLPAGYGYIYYCAGYGYAISVKEQKIIIISKSKQFTFPREKILSYSSHSLAKGTVIGGTVAQSMRIQMELAQEGFNEGGIFFEIDDIDNPVLQVRHKMDADIERSVQVLRQFFNGSLPEFAEYLRNRKAAQ